MSVSIYDGTNDELNQIAGREDVSFWEGTQAQWDALSSADKALWTGKYVIITDDEGENEKVTFTSNDIANTDTSKTDSGWTNTEILTSGETLPNICTKVSNMFKNIRRLWQTVGTTALSTTITEEIGALNNKSNYIFTDNVTGNNAYNHPLFSNGFYTAIQSWSGDTGYRLQVNDAGNIELFETTDKGATWTLVKRL